MNKVEIRGYYSGQLVRKLTYIMLEAKVIIIWEQ